MYTRSYMYKKRNYKLNVIEAGIIRESLEYFRSAYRKSKDYKTANRIYRVRRSMEKQSDAHYERETKNGLILRK